MSFWNTIAGMFGIGRLANVDRGLQSAGNETRTTEADVTVTDERAMGVSAAWACVRLIVNSGSTLPLQFYTKASDGDRQPVPDTHPMVRLMRRQPNGWMNAKELRMALFTQRVLWGNAFAHIRRRGDGQVAALVPLRPGAVAVVREDDGTRYEVNTENGQKVYWNRIGKPPEVFHWRGFSPDGVMGMSPLAYARDVLGVAISADRFASKSFTGRPAGVLTVDDFLKDDQRKQLRELYGNIGTTGTGNGQWWLLEGGMKYATIGMPPDQMQMLESRQFSVAEICRFYGVPTVMVDGSGTASTWPASYEKQVLAFLTFTLKPYLEEFEEKMLSILPDGMYAEHNVEGFLRADSQARATFFASALQNGWMTRAEVRKRENLPYMQGTDDLTVQVNLVPVDELGDDDDVTQQAFQPAADV